jgi:hypothetical protein
MLRLQREWPHQMPGLLLLMRVRRIVFCRPFFDSWLVSYCLYSVTTTTAEI